MGDMTVEELKEKKMWFLWSAKPAKNGKVTKVPFSASGGATGTDDAHSGTWVSFDNADAARNKFQASGIGMKIPKSFFLFRYRPQGYIGFDDAEEELKRMGEFRKAQAEIEKKNEKPMSQKMFKAI